MVTAEESDRLIRARGTVRRMFAEKCSAEDDARRVASTIFWAQGLDGPIKDAADRILRLWVQGVAMSGAVRKAGGSEEVAMKAFADYISDLRALTLSRHAGFWTFLIQAFRVEGAVEEELDAYLAEFASKLERQLFEMTTDRGFNAIPSKDGSLEPWAMALSLHGRFWVDGRERGVPEADLMKALWEARPIK